jgi:lysophospholipase L1-like esterase
MRRTIVASLAISATVLLAQPAGAGTMTYLALGDSLAFGETTFTQNPSNGDRGYVADYANFLATQNGGVAPNVVSLGIDGETTSSFLTGTGRVISIAGMTDQQLAAWNTNYTNPAVSQNQMMQQEILSAQAAGNPVGVVTISLGANDLFKLAADPTFLAATPAVQQQMLAATLNQVGSTYAVMLAEIHALDPTAKVYAVGEYNPFPATPSNPLNAFAATAIQGLNASIQSVAGKWGATYVDTYTPFVGNEAQYTYMTVVPGDVHPNALGYSVIAQQLINATPAPEPSTLAVLGLGFAALAATARHRALRNRAA